MSGWSGEDPLNNAMVKVAARNPPSASAVKNFVKVCSSYSKEYKHIVHFVEKFVRECEDTELLPMIYAIDAILRQFTKMSQENGTKLCSRFQTNLVNTMTRFSKVNTGDKKSVKKVINKWKEKRFFDVMVLEDAMTAAGIKDDNGSRRSDGRDRPAVASANEVLDLLSSASGNGHHQGPPRGYGNSFQGQPAFQNQRGPPQHMYGRGMLPNTGMPPRGMPPRGMPPRGLPPGSMPPRDMPPRGMPPQMQPPFGQRQ